MPSWQGGGGARRDVKTIIRVNAYPLEETPEDPRRDEKNAIISLSLTMLF